MFARQTWKCLFYSCLLYEHGSGIIVKLNTENWNTGKFCRGTKTMKPTEIVTNTNLLKVVAYESLLKNEKVPFLTMHNSSIYAVQKV